MTEICPFMEASGDWIFCHDGRPTRDPIKSNPAFTCKAWGVVRYNIHSSGNCEIRYEVYGCKLIERSRSFYD